jgi:hypothetical protein
MIMLKEGLEPASAVNGPGVNYEERFRGIAYGSCGGENRMTRIHEDQNHDYQVNRRHAFPRG